MYKNYILFDHSGWWMVMIIILALLAAYIVYGSKDKIWSFKQRSLFFGVRFLAVFCILVLLLNPVIRQLTNNVEKPIVALAIDNSASIIARMEDSLSIKAKIQQLSQQLEQQNIKIEKFYLNQADTLSFDQQTSNLSEIFQNIDESMENRNLVGICFFTDGIYNKGYSPEYLNYSSPVYTVGMGDTLPQKKLKITRVRYNKTTLLGNKTPINVEVDHIGYEGQTVKVLLKENQKIIDDRNIKLTKKISEVDFLVSLKEIGLKHLTVHVEEKKESVDKKKDIKDVFFEIIETRKKILIVASSPHPDIKAIRLALNITGNYSIDLYIPSIHNQIPRERFDVVIYHGAFVSKLALNTLHPESGFWYILNNKSQITRLNDKLDFLQITKRSNQPDRVVGHINKNFSKFKIEPYENDVLDNFPPIEVPFGDYNLLGSYDILLYQKIGKLRTSKPLLVFYDNGIKKNSVLMGENIWRWKLQEMAILGRSDWFNHLIQKTVQYLAINEKKKQFIFRPVNRIYDHLKPILFETEIYNDSYERIFNSNIQLNIFSDKEKKTLVKTFDFVDISSYHTFKIPSLQRGIYYYTAKTSVGNKNFKENGTFIVEKTEYEYANLDADHLTLRKIANKTKGEFFRWEDVDNLSKTIIESQPKSLIQSTENFYPLRKKWWWYLIIFSLFSTEWVFRKYLGKY